MEWNFVIFQKDKGPNANPHIEKYIINIPVMNPDAPPLPLVFDRIQSFEKQSKSEKPNVSPFFRKAQLHFEQKRFVGVGELDSALRSSQMRCSTAMTNTVDLNNNSSVVSGLVRKPGYANSTELLATSCNNRTMSNNSMYNPSAQKLLSNVRRVVGGGEYNMNANENSEERGRTKLRVFKNSLRVDLNNKEVPDMKFQINIERNADRQINIARSPLDVFSKYATARTEPKYSYRTEPLTDSRFKQATNHTGFGPKLLSVDNRIKPVTPHLVTLRKRQPKLTAPELGFSEYQLEDTEECTMSQSRVRVLEESGKKGRQANLTHSRLYHTSEDATAFMRDISDRPGMVSHRTLTSNKRINKIHLYKHFCEKLQTDTHNVSTYMGNSQQASHTVPCLYFQARSCPNPSKLLVYLHANAENICTLPIFLRTLCKGLGMSILCPEYAGYSYYRHGQPSEERINGDLKAVVSHAINVMGYQASNIVLLGRSLGCSFAIELAKHFTVHSCILLSPFYNMKTLAYDMFGKVGSLVMKNSFKNSKKIKKVCCPVMIVHGVKDQMVKLKHARGLFGELMRKLRGDVWRVFRGARDGSRYK